MKIKKLISLFVTRLLKRKTILEFDYGFGNGNDWIFDATMNNWGRSHEETKPMQWGWGKRKDVCCWDKTRYMDKIRIKFYNWALSPEEIRNNYEISR